MAVADRVIEKGLRDLAIKLARHDRWSELATVEVAAGSEILVPMWLTYVSRAEQLVREREILGK